MRLLGQFCYSMFRSYVSKYMYIAGRVKSQGLPSSAEKLRNLRRHVTLNNSAKVFDIHYK